MTATEKMKTFEELECWKACADLRRFVSSLLKSFPKEEKYTLVDQMKRASRSTTNNIAEGYGRFHYQENAQFCRQSRGSLYELLDHFTIAYEENYISKDDYELGRTKIDKSLTILNGYINYLLKAKEENK